MPSISLLRWRAREDSVDGGSWGAIIGGSPGCGGEGAGELTIECKGEGLKPPADVEGGGGRGREEGEGR